MLLVDHVCAYYIVESQNMHSQLSSAQLQLSSAAQRRAVPRHRVLCCAALCFLSNIESQVSCEVPGTRYRYVRVYSSFCFLHWLFSLPALMLILRSISQITNYARTADQNETSPTSTQHSTGQSVSSALSTNSWLHQIMGLFVLPP